MPEQIRYGCPERMILAVIRALTAFPGEWIWGAMNILRMGLCFTCADFRLLRRGRIRAGGPSPIRLCEGLQMTLPGIYAAESARHGGDLVKIIYPWSQA